MRRIDLLAVLFLAGCAAETPPTPAAAPVRPPPPAAPAPVSVAPAPISVAPPPKPDQCGAYLLTGLVGRPRTEIPIPLDPTRRRVICTTCPRTPDVRTDRLTIEYDQATGKVTKLGCG